MCCHVDKIGVAIQDEAHALAHNAVRTTFLHDVRKQLKGAADKLAQPASDEVRMTQIQVPADGWCLWHSLNAARNLAEYMRVPRYSSGYPAHPRQMAQEIELARALRDQALQASSDKSDVSQARTEIAASSLVDVPLLDWVGRALDLAIRCTIHDTAKNWVSAPLDAVWGVRRSMPDVHLLFEWIQPTGSTKLCGHYSVLIHDLQHSAKEPCMCVPRQAKHFSDCLEGAARQLWADAYQYAHGQDFVADATNDMTQDGIACR